MALLAADIGNGHTVIGVLEGDEVVAHWRVATDESRTSDEWALLVNGLVPADLAAEVSGVAVCSAVPSVLREWREMLAGHFADVPHVLVEPGVRTGLPILMDNPREVGADRIANSVAAAARYGGPVIVVDLGTATTFDVVDARGRFVGGAIAPGIEISLDALERRGAQLRKVELLRPRSVIAKNTVEALQSGLVFGMASQVEGMVARISAELGVDPAEVGVVATGHLAPVVLAESACFTAHAPWLTLQGLALIFSRNS